MNKQEQTEFEKKVLDQFMSGKSLFGNILHLYISIQFYDLDNIQRF